MGKKTDEKKFILTEEDKNYITSAVEIFTKLEDGFETRYKTWNKCHDYFVKLYKDNKGKSFKELKDIDKELSLLHLGYYLASWGMYRGSSFVLQYDNSIFKGVIDVILKKDYDNLWNLSYEYIKDNKDNVRDLLVDLREKIVDELSSYRDYFVRKRKGYDVEEEEVSQTLVTKILLGTICCCPAYDKYFSDAIKGKYNNFYNDDKIENFLNLIINNSDYFKYLADKYKNKYPLMKIIDIAYFTIGIEKTFKKLYDKYENNGMISLSDDDKKEFNKQINLFYFQLNPALNVKKELHAAFAVKENKENIIIKKIEEFQKKLGS